MNLDRRLTRLEGSPAFQDSQTPLFDVYPEDRDAWALVSADVRAHLVEVYRRCGGYGEPPQVMVRRHGDGWRVSTLNTHFGRACYLIGATWNEMGGEGLHEWLLGYASEAEIELFARLLEAQWDPEALEEGEGVRLEHLADRLPKKLPPYSY